MGKAEKALRAQMKAQAAERRVMLFKALVGLSALALAVVGLPILIVAAVVAAVLVTWPDRLYSRSSVVLGVVPAVAGVLLIGGYWQAYSAVVQGAAGAGSYAALVVYGLAFGPLLGGVAARVLRKRREAHPLKGQDAEQARTKLEDGRKRRVRHWVQEQAYGGTTAPQSRAQAVRKSVAVRAAVPLGSERGPYLGGWLHGDLEAWQSRNGRFCEAPWTYGGMGPHLYIAGQSGSGKSETVYRLTEWAMRHVRRGQRRGQVIFISGKQAAPGSEPSRRLVAHAEAEALSANVLVPGYRPYDFMRGTPSEIRNRLMDVELFSEPHHKAGTTVTLAFGLEKLAREGRPAAALPDVLRELLDRDKVKQWAAQDPYAAKLLDTIDERSWNGAIQRYTANAMDLAGWAGPPADGGFAFEDADVTCVDLPTSTEPEAARMLMRLLLSDLEAWLASDRRPRGDDGSFVPVTVVIEELSAVDSDPIIGRRIANLMERMRSAEAKAVVVTQDLSGIGDERTQNAVVGQSTVVTYRQSQQAEDFAKLAGTRKVAEASGTYTSRWRAQERADSGSLRMQDQYAINPNEIRELGRGECFVILGNRFAKVATTMSELGYGLPESEQVSTLDQQRRERREDVPESVVTMNSGGDMKIGDGDV